MEKKEERRNHNLCLSALDIFCSDKYTDGRIKSELRNIQFILLKKRNGKFRILIINNHQNWK